METKIRNLIKEAMVGKNKNKQITYKSILENAQKLAKNDGNRAVADADFVKATKNEIKANQDLLGFCEVNSDRYRETTRKIDYCMAILPKMATESDILAFLNSENIEKSMGSCMKALKANFGELLDGKLAQEVVKNYIS